MKAKQWLTALIISFFCSTLAVASPTLDNLDQNNGIAALQVGDALGLEVLQRSELESVRGEVIPQIIAGATLAAMAYLYYKWATDPQWVVDNQVPRTLFNETRN